MKYTQRGFIIQGIVAIVALVLIAAGAYVVSKKTSIKTEGVRSELVSAYPALKEDSYKQSKWIRVNLETEASLCESQDVINYRRNKPNGGGWFNVDVFDCGLTYYIYENSDSGPKLFGPFSLQGTSAVDMTDWKTYANEEFGFSFQYPAKLSLRTSDGYIVLSHTIPFENRDGGCNMMDGLELSKTLTDFSVVLEVMPGDVKPSYVDGPYSVGQLNGNYAYVGAEGCGQTKYYFPVSGNRTLVVTKNELQVLSPVVSEEVRNKVLAVPGVISYEEAKTILKDLLSSFKFTN